MILKALEMQGFKSFADKTVFEFERGITAVVGPNGSGKSNVSDAIRWVLGEQSSKSLRGSKMEDVIFSGTGKRRAMGYAQVTLRLDNTDKSIKKYDTDEVCVTRRYYRSGESEYAVNGSPVRLRDIHEMFMDTGLGRDGYSMVSQGKIDTMISSKSSERREMFEEAAGISHYRYSRNDSLRKLEQSEENLVRLRDILCELENRIGPLKQQSEKAEKFLTLAGEKKELEIGLWLHTIETAKKNLRLHEDKLSIASAEYERAENELAKIEEKIEAAINEAQSITAKIEEIRLENSKNEEKALALDSKKAVLENSAAHNLETIERLRKEKFENTGLNQAIATDIEKNKSEISSFLSIINERKEKFASLSEEMNLAQERGGNLAEKSAALSAKLALLTQELADSRVASQAAHSSIDEIRSREKDIDSLMILREKNIGELEKQKSSQESELDKLKQSITSLSNSVEGYEMRRANRQKKANEMKRDIDALRFDIQKKDSRAKMLEELEKNMEGYSGAVKAVTREKKRGALSGIHGPVSQLISVKDEYAAAVETAFGAAIQYIVTDNENDAKRSIEFLKRANAGRATFLPLTAIKPRRLDENGLENCKGYVGIASTLLSYDQKYDAVIKNLLAKTVVTEDMDSAIAMGKKYQNRFKIVTLDGQVINAGGSMTGGSRAQNSGILSRAAEIERLKKDTSQLSQNLEKISAEYEAALAKLKYDSSRLDGAKAELLNLQEEKIRREGSIRVTGEQLSTEQRLLEGLGEEKAVSRGRIEDILKVCARSDEKIKEISLKIEQTQKEIDENGDLHSKALELKEEISEKAAKIRLDISNAQKDIEIRDAAIKELEKRLASQSDKAFQLESEIEQLKEKNESILSESERIKDEAASLRESSKATKEEISALQSHRNETEALSTKMRMLERDKTAQRERISGELARLEERKAAMLKEYDDTVNKLYDEYQLTRREAEQLNIKIDDPAASKRKLADIKGRIRALGSVNVSAIEEYKEVSQRYDFMYSQVEDVEKSKAELIRLIDELTKKMAEQFTEQFAKINEQFSITFRELFSGGSAVLRLEDPSDVLESGIEIKVQPPGKNVQNIDLLSGGEKALSAIALLISIIKVNPAPFCIFDEVEAALDEINVSKYAQYIRRMTDTTQFILITHRRGSMEEADVLYGVTMQEEGVSRLLELKTTEMTKKLGIS